MDNNLLQMPDVRSLDKVMRKLGIDSIEGRENGLPVLTITVGNTLFMALIHNQCLKLIYRLHDQRTEGGVAFANHWNTTNFVGTLIPMTDGYVMKYETLASEGMIAGNLRETIASFAAAIDKFLDDWFALTS